MSPELEAIKREMDGAVAEMQRVFSSPPSLDLADVIRAWQESTVFGKSVLIEIPRGATIGWYGSYTRECVDCGTTSNDVKVRYDNDPLRCDACHKEKLAGLLDRREWYAKRAKK